MGWWARCSGITQTTENQTTIKKSLKIGPKRILCKEIYQEKIVGKLLWSFKFYTK